MKNGFQTKDWVLMVFAILISSLVFAFGKGSTGGNVMLTLCVLLLGYLIIPCLFKVKWRALVQEHQYGGLAFHAVISMILLVYFCRCVMDLLHVWAILA